MQEHVGSTNWTLQFCFLIGQKVVWVRRWTWKEMNKYDQNTQYTPTPHPTNKTTKKLKQTKGLHGNNSSADKGGQQNSP